MKKKVSDIKKKKLTLKQQRFIDEYLKTGNATEAASRVYKTKNRDVAKSIGPENLAKPCIKDGIEDRLKIAKDKVFHLINNAEKEDVQLRAADSMIDRIEGKPTQRVVQTNTNLDIDLSTATQEEIDAIIARGQKKA